MEKPRAPRLWMELSIDRIESAIRVSARGSSFEQTKPRTLDEAHAAPAWIRFAASVQQAAANGKPLAPALLAQAQAGERALLAGEIETLLATLRSSAAGPLLMRLMLHDPALQAVPWEALCKPGEALGFWGNAPDLLPVRGVRTTEPWQPREIHGAVRVLAIAPTGGSSLATLELALAERVAGGEVEWLPPIEAPAARYAGLVDRLRREPSPHVLHFLGYGGIDSGGNPVLRLADDDDGEETWLPIELLAQDLKPRFSRDLKLIVLEACEGAKPGAFASAAEILARNGADAVVAHLWPVKADVARLFSAGLYRALAGADRSGGDVALAMNEARRAILAAFAGSAEASSPVLYLRGEGAIFDFAGRKVAPPIETAPVNPSAIDSSLLRVLREPFSLVLGDRWKDEGATSALAPLLGPGVHTTLLRHPGLELSLAEAQPDVTIYVIHPGQEGSVVMQRERGSEGWRALTALPEDLDLKQDLLVLRPYPVSTPEQAFIRHSMTEDDDYLRLQKMWSTLSLDRTNAVLRNLSRRPALMVGLSMLTGHVGVLLHNLYPRRLPPGSVAVVDPENTERKLWASGAGLPDKGRGVKVLETTGEALAQALRGLGDAKTERGGR